MTNLHISEERLVFMTKDCNIDFCFFALIMASSILSAVLRDFLLSEMAHNSSASFNLFNSYSVFIVNALFDEILLQGYLKNEITKDLI
jgi:hypothetical protein